MASLKPLRLLGAAAAGSEIQLVQEFEQRIGGRLSPTYKQFCAEYGGGYPLDENAYLIPHSRHRLYWDFCSARVIDPGGQIDVICLYGVTSDEKLDLQKRTENSWRVWHLPSDFWVVASDGLGKNLVSRLKDGADEVYLWELHVDPCLFQISDSLLEFYNSLEPVPVEIEDDEG